VWLGYDAQAEGHSAVMPTCAAGLLSVLPNSESFVVDLARDPNPASSPLQWQWSRRDTGLPVRPETSSTTGVLSAVAVSTHRLQNQLDSLSDVCQCFIAILPGANCLGVLRKGL